MSDHEIRIQEAVAFLRDAADDRSTAIELLKDDGFDGNEIMEALGRLATEGN